MSLASLRAITASLLGARRLGYETPSVRESRSETVSPGDKDTPVVRSWDERGSPAGRPSLRDFALLEELRFVRREAQLEANLAYEHWHSRPSGESYAVYLAAQDRADAAQDDLAVWACQIAA